MEKAKSPMLLSISKTDQAGMYIAKVQMNDELIEFIIATKTTRQGILYTTGGRELELVFHDNVDCRTNVLKAVRIFHSGGPIKLPFDLDQNCLAW